MRHAVLILACLAFTILFAAAVPTAQSNHPLFRMECSGGNDPIILRQLDDVLRKNNSYYKEFPLIGFFVYDLTDPSNSYISSPRGNEEQGCITFKDGHAYHFSLLELAASNSHIAFLEGGKLKIFNSINCKDGKAGLDGVLNYAAEKLSSENKDDTITRLKHYRRYGRYRTVDTTEYRCRDERIAPNADKLYSRVKLLGHFSNVLWDSHPKSVQRNYPAFPNEAERAVGFFIYDLTDPSNKQTSLSELIEFKNGHVYHFADIDLPFSFSHIAVLDEGNVKFFRRVNCEGKGDGLRDVISYLNEKLAGQTGKEEILARVRDFRRYGVYASLNGLSTPQCNLIENSR